MKLSAKDMEHRQANTALQELLDAAQNQLRDSESALEALRTEVAKKATVESELAAAIEELRWRREESTRRQFEVAGDIQNPCDEVTHAPATSSSAPAENQMALREASSAIISKMLELVPETGAVCASVDGTVSISASDCSCNIAREKFNAGCQEAS